MALKIGSVLYEVASFDEGSDDDASDSVSGEVDPGIPEQHPQFLLDMRSEFERQSEELWERYRYGSVAIDPVVD